MKEINLFQKCTEKLFQLPQDIISIRLKNNWFFIVSAMAFWGLTVLNYSSAQMNHFLNVVISLLGSTLFFLLGTLIFSSKFQSAWNYVCQGNRYVKVFSALSSAGICLGSRDAVLWRWGQSVSFKSLVEQYPVIIDIIGVVSIFLVVIAFYSVFVCIQAFIEKMHRIVAKTTLLNGIERREIVIYSILLLIAIVYVLISFSSSGVFFGFGSVPGKIYTSDTDSLVPGNCYLALTHPENDLRQPLFAAFAAPFLGMAYLLGKILGNSTVTTAIFLNCAQTVMLFAANFILVKTMHFSPVKRIWFMAFSCVTYTQMLFTLMMEQYIIAYFWLVFCIYLICENRKKSPLALWGAGGTLLTGMVLLPFTSERSPLRNFRLWCRDMIKNTVGFFALILAFGRFDVLFDSIIKIKLLRQFTGVSVGFYEKVCQYLSFVSACFFAPDAGVSMAADGYIAWKLNPITGVNLLGVFIFVLCMISAWCNRNKKSSLFAAGWIGFSIFILVIMGWGTSENGLILYALYFAWPFFCLLFQLIEKIEEKLCIQCLVPAFSVISIAALLAINIPSIIELIQFAITYYPL